MKEFVTLTLLPVAVLQRVKPALSKMALTTVLMIVGANTHAVLPSVEVVVNFTGSIAAGGNGAYPPAGNSGINYPFTVFVEDNLGYLYGSSTYGGGFEAGSIGFANNGGIGEVFYRYRDDVGQEILDRSVLTGNTRPVNPSFISNGYLYSTEGGLRRWSGSQWELLAEISGAVGGPWIEGADGRLYNGNSAQKLYVVDKEGAGEIETLFEVNNTIGRQLTIFLSHTDGRLYGTGRILKNHGNGNAWRPFVFSILPDGTDFTLVAEDIGDIGVHGGTQITALVSTADGYFYGTTLQGGDNNSGSVFRVKTDGTDYALLYSFGGVIANTTGRTPNALTLGADGHLYGSTSVGGINGNGVIFRWNTTVDAYEVLYAFDELMAHTAIGQNVGYNDDGRQPFGLMTASNGHIYGLARLGGQHGWGTLFKFHPGDEVPAFKYRPNLKLSATAAGNVAAHMRVSAEKVALGREVQFAWSGELIENCAASSTEPGNLWNGPRPESATADPHTPDNLGNWNYTLTCDSTSTDFPAPLSATYAIEVLPVEPVPESGGNGGAVSWWLMASLSLLALRRRYLF